MWCGHHGVLDGVTTAPYRNTLLFYFFYVLLLFDVYILIFVHTD